MSAARISLLTVLLLSCSLRAQQPKQPQPPAMPGQEQIARWITQLGDDNFFVREAATEKLAAVGEKAEPPLKVALASSDAEVVRRARDFLEQIRDAQEIARTHTTEIWKLVEKAKSEKKVVMVNFYADWCGPCKTLDSTTFLDDKVRKFLQENAITVKINIDENKKLVAEHKVNALPCLLFLNSEGKEVGRVLGFREPEKFLEEVSKIVVPFAPAP